MGWRSILSVLNYLFMSKSITKQQGKIEKELINNMIKDIEHKD